MNRQELILQAFDVMVAKKIWHDVSASSLLKILMFLESKGWLYILEDKAVVAAYRIKEISELTKIPENECGTILYVPMVISLKKEENVYKIVRSALNIYLEENPDITELVLEDKNEKLKRYKIGDKNGKLEESTATSYANVSTE